MKFETGFILQADKMRCLNHWHHGVLCTHCAQRCPTEAIAVEQHTVYHDADTCVGCGLCISSCPTEVFTAKQWDETAIPRDVEGNGWTKTHMFCGYHDKPYNVGPGGTGAMRVPGCLAGLSKGLWFELGKLTQVELHLEFCTDCELKDNLPHLAGHVTTAAEWLMAVGIEPMFFEVLEPGEGKSKKKHRAIDTGLNVTSRRDLFLGLLERGKAIISEERQEEKGKKHGGAYAPGWMLRLEESYPKTPPQNDRAAYWSAIHINENCKGCGLCTSYCPTGALRLDKDSGTYTHLFQSGRCIDCRICEVFCPSEAISRSRRQTPTPFAVSSVRAAEGVRCRRCDMPTVHTAEGLCYWCWLEENMESDLLHICKQVLFKDEDHSRDVG